MSKSHRSLLGDLDAALHCLSRALDWYKEGKEKGRKRERENFGFIWAEGNGAIPDLEWAVAVCHVTDN